ncbi:hypothetical protein CAEBREN_16376 [Caenorhabditis brenneri]|uniref:F-box domain-containing protein n=1 Tax=Caenorhabditis brenneri TaxID=135651 RepID=G0M937_CAEBE|nr:hypothetical protein CAEBREN_16376 [Caenorhabditis brenneri]
MLRRRIQEILSRKFPRWVFDDRTGPLDWSLLPMEMKREIVKHADIRTRHSLRQCSHQDKQIVDSFKISLPFVRIESDHNYASLMICESRTQILKVVLTRKKFRFRRKTVVQISDNIAGEKYEEFCKNEDLDVVLQSLLGIISWINITIDTLNLDLKYPHDAITKYLDIHYRQCFGPRRKTRVICSSMEFSCAQVHFLPIDETRIISDLVTNWQSGRLMMAGKKYNIVPMGHFAEIGQIAFWKPSLLECNLGALISGILWKMAGEMVYYYIPGLEVTEAEQQELARRFEAVVRRHGVVNVLSITDGADVERKLYVKISTCGVQIQKAGIDEDPRFPKEGCMLDWMCSKCDKSVKSWYFRTTNRIKGD